MVKRHEYERLWEKDENCACGKPENNPVHKRTQTRLIAVLVFLTGVVTLLLVWTVIITLVLWAWRNLG